MWQIENFPAWAERFLSPRIRSCDFGRWVPALAPRTGSALVRRMYSSAGRLATVGRKVIGELWLRTAFLWRREHFLKGVVDRQRNVFTCRISSFRTFAQHVAVVGLVNQQLVAVISGELDFG